MLWHKYISEMKEIDISVAYFFVIVKKEANSGLF